MKLLTTKSLSDYNMKKLRITWGEYSEDQRNIFTFIAALQIVKDSNIKLYASGLGTFKPRILQT